MPQRSKYTPEEKVRFVEDYLSGRMGTSEFSHNYGSDGQVLRDWARLYQVRGIEGLTPALRTKKYSIETKRLAVMDYIEGLGSSRDICTKYDISDRKMLRRWVKRYNSHGDFGQPNSGGATYMAKGRDATLEERIEIVSFCIANNKDYGKTIEQYGISYQQIYGWVKKYEKSGHTGLIDRRGKRKEEAFMTEVEKLRAQLKLKEAENLRLQMENDLLKKLEEIERGRLRG